MSKLKIEAPHHHIFEKVALELAATWYEIGRSQGLTSKYKTTKAYAKANFEKFIPKAIDHCLDMLNNPTIPDDAKQIIYDALMERVNDPSNITSTDIQLPDIDVNKLLNAIKPPDQSLVPKREPPTIIHNVSKVRH